MLKFCLIALAALVVFLGFTQVMTAVAASDMKADEDVVLFDTAAHFDASTGQWQIPIHGWIYEPEDDSVWRSALASTFVHGLNIQEDELAQQLFRERARMFLVDNERNKQLTIEVAAQRILTDRSQPNGHFHAAVGLTDAALQGYRREGWLAVSVVAPSGDERRFAGRVRLVDGQGPSVISDIDDTVKHTNVLDKRAVIENTFLKPFVVVPGMESAYASWAEQGAVFHYVSSSPWQLYPALSEFFADAGLPAGAFYLKTFRIKDQTFFDLFASPFETKLPTIASILERWPERRYVLVGDSGEKDPEVYARIYEQYPDKIAHIFIRNVTAEDGNAVRYREVFAGVPAERWTVFADPAVLKEYVVTKGND